MSFSTPIDQRFFEDYLPGDVHELGSVAVSQSEIIEFARRYDPQAFHIDPAAAEHSVFGGLIASGWHTASMAMRLLVEHYLSSVATLGSPGLEQVRWSQPVRPGDVLSVRATVEEARRSGSKPDRGILRTRVEVINQQGEMVMTMQGLNFMLCRDRPTQIR